MKSHMGQMALRGMSYFSGDGDSQEVIARDLGFLFFFFFFSFASVVMKMSLTWKEWRQKAFSGKHALSSATSPLTITAKPELQVPHPHDA